MPLMHARTGELKKEYLKRFMSAKKYIEEYPDNKQRYAIAINLWNKQRRKRNNEANYLYFTHTIQN